MPHVDTKFLAELEKRKREADKGIEREKAIMEDTERKLGILMRERDALMTLLTQERIRVDRERGRI